MQVPCHPLMRSIHHPFALTPLNSFILPTTAVVKSSLTLVLRSQRQSVMVTLVPAEFGDIHGPEEFSSASLNHQFTELLIKKNPVKLS